MLPITLLSLVAIYLTTQARTCDWLLATVIRADGNHEIYLSTETQPQPRNLTHNARTDDGEPIWSPDGRSLVYVAEYFETSAIQLKLLNLATGETRLLSEAYPYHEYHAVWSPDGRYLALRTQLEGIVVVDQAGETILSLDKELPFDLPMAWSPDSQQIVFSVPGADAPSNGESWQLMTADVPTGAVQRLTAFEFSYDVPGPRRPYWLYWLPENRIAMTRQYVGGPEYALDLLDTRDGSLTQLAERIVTLGPPGLAADGDHLLYSTGNDLHELDLRTGAVRNLTAALEQRVFAQALLPPGDVVTFNTYEQTNTLYWMDIELAVLYPFLNAANLELLRLGD